MADESRRPAVVVERDRAVARSLQLGPKPLALVAEELTLAKNQVYGALHRLRRRGLAEKLRVGGRTPVWGLTPAGQVVAQGGEMPPDPTTSVALAPAPEVPAPVEVPAVAEVPPPAAEEPVPVPPPPPAGVVMG